MSAAMQAAEVKNRLEQEVVHRMAPGAARCAQAPVPASNSRAAAVEPTQYSRPACTLRRAGKSKGHGSPAIAGAEAATAAGAARVTTQPSLRSPPRPPAARGARSGAGR